MARRSPRPPARRTEASGDRNRRIRRTLVVSGVIASLLAGVVSIRFAADMTAAAAPPPAPPVSLDSLKTALAAEQARGAALQAQLDDLMAVTDQLTAALASTEGEVKVDGLTAKELRARLKAADAKLKTVNRLLKEAQRRLVALGAAPVKTPKPTSGDAARERHAARRSRPRRPLRAATPFDLLVEVGVRRCPRHVDGLLRLRVRQLCAGPLDRLGDPLPTRGRRHPGRTDRGSRGVRLHGRGPRRVQLVPAVLPDIERRRDEDRRPDVDGPGECAMRSLDGDPADRRPSR